MPEKTQTFENHAKIVPAYHIAASGILVVFFLWSGWRVVSSFSIDAVMTLLLTVALIIMLLYIRLFPLKVQDRLIRLEETMRMREVLPAEMQSRIGEIRGGQFIALRFAPDEELPGLVEKVLAGELRTSKDIKRAIKNWRADYRRM